MSITLCPSNELRLKGRRVNSFIKLLPALIHSCPVYDLVLWDGTELDKLDKLCYSRDQSRLMPLFVPPLSASTHNNNNNVQILVLTHLKIHFNLYVPVFLSSCRQDNVHTKAKPLFGQLKMIIII